MPPTRTTFRRVVLKLSGEAFGGEGEFGVETATLRAIASEIALARAGGCQIAVVVGGGNIIRGGTLAKAGLVGRAAADELGMLGTVINALALREALLAAGVTARAMSAFPVGAIVGPFVRTEAIAALERGEVVILGGGVGSPFFTTDTTAVLRAAELDAGAVLKATKVDGVYTADPKKDRSATRYEQLTFREACDKKLGVMDLTALSMCEERGLPVVVFDFKPAGNIKRVVGGENVGTLITP